MLVLDPWSSLAVCKRHFNSSGGFNTNARKIEQRDPAEPFCTIFLAFVLNPLSVEKKQR